MNDENKVCEKGEELEDDALEDDALEAMLCDKARKQVRSDYRRSLGNEHRRRYLE